MKLVVDIPDDEYYHMINTNKWLSNLSICLKNSKPLEEVLNIPIHKKGYEELERDFDNIHSCNDTFHEYGIKNRIIDKAKACMHLTQRPCYTCDCFKNDKCEKLVCIFECAKLSDLMLEETWWRTTGN